MKKRPCSDLCPGGGAVEKGSISFCRSRFSGEKTDDEGTSQGYGNSNGTSTDI